MVRRIGQVCLIICLAGLPFAPFFWINKLDLWHAHNAWMHGWLGVLLCLVFLSGFKKTIGNKAIAMWFGWVTFITWLSFNQIIERHSVYNWTLLSAYIHMLLIILFYLIFTQIMDRDAIIEWLDVMAYPVAVLIAYGYLQILNLDQFFKQTNMGDLDILVGTIGNPAHFNAYLACCVPIIFRKEGLAWNFVKAAMIGLFIIFIVKYKSIGGVLSAGAALLFISWFKSKKLCLALCLTLLVAGISAIEYIPALISSSGRIDSWREFYSYFAQRPILGFGAGFTGILGTSPEVVGTAINKWRHVHNEFFQIAIEQGVIGLFFIGYIVSQLILKIKNLSKTPELITLTGILIAFTLNCLVNFPAHLWMIGAVALAAYCGVYTLATEEYYVKYIK